MPRPCSWFLPPNNLWSLHCDGSLSDGRAAFGGVIRNAIGQPVAAFANQGLELCILSMELVAIHRGISLCIERGILDVSIRSDSKLAIDTISGKVVGPWKVQPLKSRILALANDLRMKEFTHVWREQNRPADFMAAVPCDSYGVVWDPGDFPPALIHYLEQDSDFVTYYRP
ncbi:uncharacterized protein LOC122647780 [Telopea speciosissima]|uniref:uncharacterized protein LOC122647780 n=1 Tax=Telopea speciosissima TaxID=54955 RepID=UPI001CC7C60E|nr:uncharacterized protein LOC122647780 [Telopea speciosissima]